VLGSLFTFNVDVVVSVILSYIALVFVALILLLAAVYAFLLPSSRTMAVWRPEEFSTVYSLLVAGYAGGLVSTVITLNNTCTRRYWCHERGSHSSPSSCLTICSWRCIIHRRMDWKHDVFLKAKRRL
jgi:hypothetical protein